MGRQRREFSAEYKDEAVKLVISTGRTVAVVARELGINEATLGRWVNLHKDRHGVGEAPLSESERACYDRVSAILGDTVRASSAVECMNSVLRVQQSRHKRMTQPMLDLKRLYWNSRAFREGKRRGQRPYEILGLTLPSYGLMDLLKLAVAEPQAA